MISKSYCYFNNEELEELNPSIKQKVLEIGNYFQQIIEDNEKTFSSEIRAIHSALALSNQKLEEEIRLRIEKELEITQLNSQISEFDTLSRKSPTKPIKNRKESVILKYKLLQIKKIKSDLESKIKILNSQINFLISNSGNEKHELLRTLAEFASEIDSLRESTDHRKENPNFNSQKNFVNEILDLKKQQKSYQETIYSKSVEIYNLTVQLNRQESNNSLLEHYKILYNDLHKVYLNQNITIVLLRIENSDLSKRIAYMKKMQENFDSQNKANVDILNSLEYLKSVNELLQKKVFNINNKLSSVSERTRELDLIDDESKKGFEPCSNDSITNEEILGNNTRSNGISCASIDLHDPFAIIQEFINEIKRALANQSFINQKFYSLRFEIKNLFESSAKYNEYLAIENNKLNELIQDPNSTALMETLDILKKENEILRSRINENFNEILIENEKLKELVNCWDENRIKEENEDLKRKNTQAILENNELKKEIEKLIENDNYSKLKLLEEEINKKDQYINKQNILIEKFKKLKEAFIKLKAEKEKEKEKANV